MSLRTSLLDLCLSEVQLIFDRISVVQPNIRMCDLLDGVQPLLLGGLLGFELGLLLRIGFRGDLLINSAS